MVQSVLYDLDRFNIILGLIVNKMVLNNLFQILMEVILNSHHLLMMEILNLVH